MVEDEELLIDEEGNILPRGNEDNEISKENNPAINTDKGNVLQSEDKKEKKKNKPREEQIRFEDL